LSYTKCRTATFSLLEGLIQISQLLGPAVGASLLTLGGVFKPYYFTIPLALLSIPLALLLPSGTRSIPLSKPSLSNVRHPNGDSISNQEDGPPEEHQNLLSSGDTEDPPASLNNQESASIAGSSPWVWSKQGNVQHFFKTIRSEFKQSIKIFTQYPIVRFSYAAFLVVTLGKQALHILLQYVSKRFGVTIAEVSSS
jgi:MFS family permease